jgi:3'-phosphoadenosine 5'-phosphosulfate sulfotransferase (PAPS reductase)/FAD synthetase
LVPTADDAALWNQLAPMLDEAVSRLGQKDRDAVMLRFFKGQNLREVAAAFERPTLLFSGGKDSLSMLHALGTRAISFRLHYIVSSYLIPLSEVKTQTRTESVRGYYL